MRKNEEKKAEPHMCLKNSSLQKMISSVDGQYITVMMLKISRWWSKYYSVHRQNNYNSNDAQNITVMLRILLSWSSEYYSDDAPDIGAFPKI